MIKKYKMLWIIGFILLTVLFLEGCSQDIGNDESLNPDKPITVTVWHYYNGNIKKEFDELVSEFNETLGVEKGIVVEAKSQGDVNQLATEVFDSANKSIGSLPMPEIFASYPDNAYRVSQIVDLVSLEEYFSEEELNSYRQEFLEEGKFLEDEKAFIVPIAKSSENLFVNKNYWEDFSSKHGFNEDNLRTWEGIYNVAKTYYEATGKGFFGIDGSANFMLQSSMQLGVEMFDYSDIENVKLNFTEDVARKIWDYYYRPYIKGYYVKTARFCSDDAKTGTVLAYTGSTAGAAYFPTEVTFSEKDVHEIEPLALPYPYFEGGKLYAIQQGAGMCIAKSDRVHEYAAAIFLKWFIEPKQNIKFSISTGYFPVKNEALNEELLIEALESSTLTNPALKASIITTNEMFKNYRFYNNKPFLGSYEMRVLLERNLYDKIIRDLEIIDKRVSEGENRDKLIEELISENEFKEWYQQMLHEADLIMKN